MSNWRIGLTALALASTLVAGTVVAQQRAISIATGMWISSTDLIGLRDQRFKTSAKFTPLCRSRASAMPTIFLRGSTTSMVMAGMTS